ncbi:gamma-glutamyltransferase [Xylariaceae sp. FL0255]|nr:gamma-glutamyltransferase [Xylariaceae sp. FL0255]
MRCLKDLPQSLLLLVLLATTSSPAKSLPLHWSEPNGQSVLTADDPQTGGSRGAVASESRVCSQIGIDLLAKGGNAVDAWVGTQLCVGVIGMYHSGIGGGGFALIRDSAGEYHSLDYRETAPAAASEDMYQGNVRGSVFTGLAAGVPGELRGLEYAHTRFGALDWKDVVMPAALVARDGFEVTEDMVRYMAFGINSAGWNFFLEDPSWALDFAPDGFLVKLGDTICRKRLADTLEKIAEGGADVFYNGEMANATIATIQSDNGTMTLSDLASYTPEIRRCVSITYNGYRLFSTAAPSSGAVALSILKTMEGYSSNTSLSDVNLTTHRFDESMRFAYGARQELGDPAFVSGINSLENKMLDAAQAAAIRGRILDNATQPISHYDPARVYTTPSHGTSHVVTASHSHSSGSTMSVTSTTTINLLFGNLQMVPSTGIILNNEMNDFSIPGVRNEFGFAPAVSNFIRAGKRPLSSITPVIVEDGKTGEFVLAVGAAGGSRIISATAQVAWRVLEYLNLNSDDTNAHLNTDPDNTEDKENILQSAIRQPRIHDQLMPDIMLVEYSFDNATAASMMEKGHNVTWVREGLSAVQGVMFGSNGGFVAGSETRQKNSAGLTI